MFLPALREDQSFSGISKLMLVGLFIVLLAFSAYFFFLNKASAAPTDGTEDTDFYTNLGTAFGGAVHASAIQTDGSVIVGGAFTTFDGNTRNRLVRLNSDGTEDTAFIQT